MKKTLLIIALFIGLGNVNAQDASNDATLVETIGFINKYSDHLFNLGNTDLDLSISSTSLSLQYKPANYQYGDAVMHSRVDEQMDLTKLIKVEEKHETAIYLYFTEKCVFEKLNAAYYENGEFSGNMTVNASRHAYSKESDFYSFKVKDSEIRGRLLTAFQHLAYLATEKRKEEKRKMKEAMDEERKASGDKF
ncbi:MAG: hypothetical protein ACI8RP_001808 [Urechidicola sp.]|jgi:hypothetical protein